MEKIIYNIKDINSISKLISKKLIYNRCIKFYGGLGAGKTTLIKALIKELGSIESGNSPTFGIVNEYSDKDGKLLAFHFDFYRIEEENEALDLGLEDYLNQDCWSFIEWPEKIPNLLPEDCVEVHLKVIDEETRELKLVNP